MEAYWQTKLFYIIEKLYIYIVLLNFNSYTLWCCIGSYTDSPGIEIIRKHVAQYIEQRDGIPSDYLNVLLCAGASDGIKVGIL